MVHGVAVQDKDCLPRESLSQVQAAGACATDPRVRPWSPCADVSLPPTSHRHGVDIASVADGPHAHLSSAQQTLLDFPGKLSEARVTTSSRRAPL